MEPSTIEQRIEILKDLFPAGSKVCNVRLGSIGHIDSEPKLLENKIFIKVKYHFGLFLEDVEFLVPVYPIKRSKWM